MGIKRHISYFKYLLKHKYYVFVEGRKSKLSILFLLLHDISKFSLSEWLPYARTFYKSDGTKQYNETPEFAIAWNYHQKRNKHHWQYWILTWDRGDVECLPMPPKYFAEMIADWRGASRAITGADNTSEWYMKNRDNIKLHPETRLWVEHWLKIPKDNYHTDVKNYIEGS